MCVCGGGVWRKKARPCKSLSFSEHLPSTHSQAALLHNSSSKLFYEATRTLAFFSQFRLGPPPSRLFPPRPEKAITPQRERQELWGRRRTTAAAAEEKHHQETIAKGGEERRERERGISGLHGGKEEEGAISSR